MTEVQKQSPVTKRSARKRAVIEGPARERHIALRVETPPPGRHEQAREMQSLTVHFGNDFDVEDFVDAVRDADPVQLVEIERHGVEGRLLSELSERMDIPTTRMYSILGIPSATGNRKTKAPGALVDGRAGIVTLGMVKLLGIAQDIVDNSTAEEAKDFDTMKWLGQWIERPQPALGGRKPADFLDTPTGQDIVARLLGAIQSGAYV